MSLPQKLNHFRAWVFWTGIFNIVAYLPLVCPFTLKQFMTVSNALNSAVGLGGTPLTFPADPTNLMLINLLGIFIVVFGIVLVIASLDIQTRAWIVFWEGCIRILAFFNIVYFVLVKNSAGILIGFGVIDLIIGLIYMYYIFSIKELKIK